MYLHISSDASYLLEADWRSWVGGYHYLSDRPKNPEKAPLPTDPPPMFNGPINVVCKIINNNVIVSATEAETGGLFINGQEAAYERQILE
jgi:hypothetical protein